MQSDFETEYDKYGVMLYKIAFLYFGNAADTEDALQEVFIKLLYRAPSFRDEEHKKAWLIRTTQNQCLDMLKKGREKASDVSEFSVSHRCDDNDLRLDVQNKIIALSERYKSVIILFYYYDYSIKEIAHTLKISTSAVKMRLIRAREQLKTELEEYNNE